jgi:PadR family transcriptional regulator, regulatory protein PadR
LEVRGLLSSKWGLSENNRRAKFYALTAVGRKQLASETQRWSRLSLAVSRVMGTT